MVQAIQPEFRGRSAETDTALGESIGSPEYISDNAKIGSCVQRSESTKRKNREERKHGHVQGNYTKATQNVNRGSSNRIWDRTASCEIARTRWWRSHR